MAKEGCTHLEGKLFVSCNSWWNWSSATCTPTGVDKLLAFFLPPPTCYLLQIWSKLSWAFVGNVLLQHKKKQMLIFPTILVFHHASSVSLTMSHYMYVCIQHTPFAAPAILWWWWWWWCSCHCLHLLSIVLNVFWKCNISFGLLLRHTVIMS
jgi:hypothetical protein